MIKVDFRELCKTTQSITNFKALTNLSQKSVKFNMQYPTAMKWFYHLQKIRKMGVL